MGAYIMYKYIPAPGTLTYINSKRRWLNGYLQRKF